MSTECGERKGTPEVFQLSQYNGKNSIIVIISNRLREFIYLFNFKLFGCLACHVWIAAIGNVTACLLIDVVCLCFLFFFFMMDFD